MVGAVVSADEDDCQHVYVNGVCQAGCNGLEPLPGDEDGPLPEEILDGPDYERVEVRVEWRSTFHVRVPKGTRTPPTLDELMELVRADGDTGGDFDTADAEPVDWEIIR